MQPIPIFAPPIQKMNLKIRREQNTQEAQNERQYAYREIPKLPGGSVVMDMNPITSRTLETRKEGPTIKSGNDGFNTNPYFDGYAPTFDPRNAVREIKGTIVEDRYDKGVVESRLLLTRYFTSSWTSQESAEKMTTIRPRATR